MGILLLSSELHALNRKITVAINKLTMRFGKFIRDIFISPYLLMLHLDMMLLLPSRRLIAIDADDDRSVMKFMFPASSFELCLQNLCF